MWRDPFETMATLRLVEMRSMWNFAGTFLFWQTRQISLQDTFVSSAMLIFIYANDHGDTCR